MKCHRNKGIMHSNSCNLLNCDNKCHRIKSQWVCHGFTNVWFTSGPKKLMSHILLKLSQVKGNTIIGLLNFFQAQIWWIFQDIAFFKKGVKCHGLYMKRKPRLTRVTVSLLDVTIDVLPMFQNGHARPLP